MSASDVSAAALASAVVPSADFSGPASRTAVVAPRTARIARLNAVAEVFSHIDICMIIINHATEHQRRDMPDTTKEGVAAMVKFYSQAATVSTGFRFAAEHGLSLMVGLVNQFDTLTAKQRELTISRENKTLVSSEFVVNLARVVPFVRDAFDDEKDFAMISRPRNCNLMMFFRSVFPSTMPAIEPPESVKILTFTDCGHDVILGPNIEMLNFFGADFEVINKLNITIRSDCTHGKIPIIRVITKDMNYSKVDKARLLKVATKVGIM